MVSEEIHSTVTKKVCLACRREYSFQLSACPTDGTVLVPMVSDPLVGTKLAQRYLIESVIGHGGMGVVYKARHELMGRTVAIKMLQAQLISDSMSVRRFQQEARAASRLKHPNVITLFDFGVTDSGQPYLVMDYLEGKSLADVIREEGQVGVDRCLRILTQACHALEHAHHQGVVHRDLKPGNIMLVEQESEKDFVKVVDFGVAKLMPVSGEEAQRLTQTGEVCGSPVYMSPEQCMGQSLNNLSDIYSMGVVLYESLTGKLPFLGKTMVDTMSKHINEDPPPFRQMRPDLYIPERLEAVVFKALQKEQSHRHQSMDDLARDLQSSIPKPAKRPALRTGAPPPAQAARNNERPPVALIAAAISVPVALCVLGFMYLHNKPLSQAKPVSTQAPIQSSHIVAKHLDQKPVANRATGVGGTDTALPLPHQVQSMPQVESTASTAAKEMTPPVIPAAKPTSKVNSRANSAGGSDAKHLVKNKLAKKPRTRKQSDPFDELIREKSY